MTTAFNLNGYGSVGSVVVDGPVYLNGSYGIYGGTFNGPVTVGVGASIYQYTQPAPIFNAAVTNSGTILFGIFTAQTRAGVGGTVSAFPATQFTDDPTGIYWYGVIDGNMDNAANWYPAVVPLMSDSITVDSTYYVNPPSTGTCVAVVSLSGGVINGGTFDNIVSNAGTLDGGTFNAQT